NAGLRIIQVTAPAWEPGRRRVRRNLEQNQRMGIMWNNRFHTASTQRSHHTPYRCFAGSPSTQRLEWGLRVCGTYKLFEELLEGGAGDWPWDTKSFPCWPPAPTKTQPSIIFVRPAQLVCGLRRKLRGLKTQKVPELDCRPWHR
uniref:Uncharacterized protein n=1 Tax=Pelusios castaneus TaxID=367368 RepID=A0A8C8SSP3_9SAUR